MSTSVAGAVQLGTQPEAPADAAPIQESSQSGYEGTINLTDADVKYAGEGTSDTAGWTVSEAGDVNGDGVDDLIIGAPRNDSAGPNSGAAYIVYGPADPGEVNLSDADVTLRGVESNDLAGWSVSTAGDVNGDGLDDVVIGAPYNDSAAPNGGAAYVVYGDESLPSSMNLSDADAVLTGTEANGLAGYSVSNVNTTGEYGSVAVGAPYADAGGENAGAAYVVSGLSLVESPGSALNLSEASTTFLGERDGSNAGWSVANAGDVDGEGDANVVIGAPRYNATAAESETGDAANLTGAAYVANAEQGGNVSLADASVTLIGVSEGDRAGWAVAGAGDLNDDGYQDVVIGAPYNDSNNRTDAGAAYAVYGGSDIDGEQSLSDADVSMAGEGALDRAGWSVSAAGSGDVTCDDVDDVLVGAPYNDSSAGENAGAAYLVSGNASLDGDLNLSNADATFLGEGEGDRAGYAVSEAGDMNDDGFEDVAIGAPYNDSNNRTDAGAAYLLFSDCEEPVGAETPTDTPTETPKTLTETPDTPTKTPETPTETPDTPTKTPETPTETPETLTETPETPTETPETLTETPDTPTKTPETPTKTPETPTETPDTPTKTPETPTETPDTPTKTPDTPTETPETPTETPETPTETPETPTKTPETPTETPETLTETPDTPTKTPETPTKTPETPTETPDTPTKTPETPTETPDTPTKTPDTPTETPETPTETPETPTETPETPTKTPETPTETPETPTKTPETPTETPETPTKTPETPTETPTKTPETPTETPETPTKTPETPTETPTKTPETPTETPETPTKTPDTETPDTETPDTETPDTETPDTETPDTETPDTETPDTETPDTETPDTETPDTETPDTETPDTETPDTETPDTETPDTETPDTETPDTETPDTETPDTETPDTETPDTETPDTETPDTETPDTETPDTETPDTETPDTETPDDGPTTDFRGCSQVIISDLEEGDEVEVVAIGNDGTEASFMTTISEGQTELSVTADDPAFAGLDEPKIFEVYVNGDLIATNDNVEQNEQGMYTCAGAGNGGNGGNAPAGDQAALQTLSQSPLFPVPFVGLMGISLAVLGMSRFRDE
ncbi:hypothetical protein [Halosimplex sp. TS25]|uniref:hypothetical protein n=1 Tax=Halosimplex rarum TaxID=3396619 RepID=UPI0039ECD7EB